MDTLHTDVFETEAAYLLHVDVPGVTKDALHVSVEGDQLLIEVGTGDKATARRTFRIPRTADADGVKVGLDLGVLTVELPKAKAATKRLVPIQVS